MKIGVRLKIDVTKIDKARLFQGKKGVYLDATMFVDLGIADQYGNNGMITQDISQAEKQQGIKGNILGNAQVFWSEAQEVQQQMQNAPAPQSNLNQAPPPSLPDDEIPF